MNRTRRTLSDWTPEQLESIALDYSAGIIGINEICKRYQTSILTIRKLAKLHKWVRPGLDKIVRQRVREGAMRTTAAAAGFKNPTEKQIIDANTKAGLDVNNRHKNRVLALLDDVAELRAEVKEATAENIGLILKKAAAYRDLALPELKGIATERGIWDLAETAPSTLQVNLGLGAPFLQGLNLVPTKKTTNGDGQEGGK